MEGIGIAAAVVGLVRVLSVERRPIHQDLVLAVEQEPLCIHHNLVAAAVVVGHMQELEHIHYYLLPSYCMEPLAEEHRLLAAVVVVQYCKMLLQGLQLLGKKKDQMELGQELQ